MPSLGDLLSRHASVLWIDAASASVQAGILAANEPARWTQVEGDAGTGVFTAVAQLGVNLGRVEAFVFCEGPGSILGIRTSAMAIRAWNAVRTRPVYAYRSLELVARSLHRAHVSVIADARRETWHCLTTDADGAPTPLRRIPTASLNGNLATPAGFRCWSALPAGAIETVPYDLASLVPALGRADLLRPTEDPDAFLHEEPTYVTWTPQVHQSPTAE
jgi:tRNA threonylcarbamoyladenosine biosynthesis protein TsaB